MALHVSDWSITSDLTPEFAYFLPTATSGHWALSWLPGVALTRAQAHSGMVLDEILSDPRLVHNALARELAALRAAELGLDLRDALLHLFARTLAGENHTAAGDEQPPTDDPRPLVTAGPA
jgi:hypothetical protein